MHVDFLGFEEYDEEFDGDEQEDQEVMRRRS